MFADDEDGILRVLEQFGEIREGTYVVGDDAVVAFGDVG